MASLTARPARLYGALARAEMVTWTLLLLGMAAKYALGADWATRIAGGIHGFVFLSYCVVTVLVAVDHRWRARDLLLGLASAVVPYATVPFERSAERRGLVEGEWRLLQSDGPHPTSPVDRAVAWALGSPALAAVGAVVVVSLIFAGLLRLGPPTQWFS
ncbi:DUF3817 domain-containing protein [Arsenicicoccus piscis]|uniref:Membrane protein n=1 Tax=Arsenicicoccus piscis TaxID=673954 RepID=A0ABQ6HU22_9MICO|nr:DUF3817 domain-containing protein [Arsenicicoccus piscis]MCH8627325.1 DUF3817 domain-containing protein [Arsenicicoccus piscis]GMA21467.1 membrane protein [Arsenicicoccus piscis]